MKQLVCPKCKHEFTYFNGTIDAEIDELCERITTLDDQLREFKTLTPAEQEGRAKWHNWAVKDLRKKKKKVAELKSYRKVADQQIMKMSFHLFKALTKEAVGLDVYYEIIDKMEADLEAYKISGCMQHEYTRSQHMSSVISINKL